MSLTNAMANLNLSGNAQSQPAAPATPAKTAAPAAAAGSPQQVVDWTKIPIDVNAIKAQVQDGKIETEALGALYLFEGDMMNLKAPLVVALIVKEQKDFHRTYRLFDPTGKCRLKLPVSSKMNFQVHQNSLVCTAMVAGRAFAWYLQFLKPEQQQKAFLSSISIGLFENERKMSFAKAVKAADREWVESAIEEKEVEDVSDDEDFQDDEFVENEPPKRYSLASERQVAFSFSTPAKQDQKSSSSSSTTTTTTAAVSSPTPTPAPTSTPATTKPPVPIFPSSSSSSSASSSSSSQPIATATAALQTPAKPSGPSASALSAAKATAMANPTPSRTQIRQQKEIDSEEDDSGSDDEAEEVESEEDDIEYDGVDSKHSSPGAPAVRSSTTAQKSDRRSSVGVMLGSNSDDRNSNLAVGMANNRTFVLRGSKIGVFRHDDQDQLEYLNKIPVIKDLEGDVFSPTKVMLHQRDSKMLLLNPNKTDSVFCMDLERGQVVEEWNVGDEVKVRNFAPTAKYAQLTNDQSLVAVNQNMLFSMDPRQKGSKIAHKQAYKTNPKLSCVSANADGQVAVGDLKGEIRLFSDIDKRAKTLLPGLGDAIVHMDVTEDGRYVLATTSRYLLLVPTELKSGKTGFDASMGKEKPRPIKLQLTAADIAKHNIYPVEFKAAHFNTGSNINEQWIVTATGPFIITWNLQAVLAGRPNQYKIKRTVENVVADVFRYNKEDQVVVTTNDDVFLEKRRIVTRKSSVGIGPGMGATPARPVKK